LGREINQRLAVFDMGGGTFDVTLLAVRSDFFEVLATGGDPFLGGDDMDLTIVDMLAIEFLKRHRIDFRTDPRAMALARITAEHIKTRLSTEDEVVGACMTCTRRRRPAAVPESRITLPQLDTLITPSSTAPPCEGCCRGGRHAGARRRGHVGGATRAAVRAASRRDLRS
jgi:hypothetical protein